MFTDKSIVKYRKIVYQFEYEPGDDPKDYIFKIQAMHPASRIGTYVDDGKTVTFAIEFETRRIL